MADEQVSLIIRTINRGRDALGQFRRNVSTTFDTARTRAQRFGQSLISLRGLFVGIATGAAVRLANSMFNIGAAVEETASKFNTVLGPAAGQMEKFLEAWAGMAGLSRREGQDMAATTTAIAQGMGFQGETAAKLAEIILRLGGDLASFNNLQGGTAEAVNILTRALVGEFDSAKSLGIVIRAAEVDHRALSNTGKRTAKDLTETERVMARLELATERAGKAVGDLHRTADSRANIRRQLSADLRSLAEDVSTAVLPALERLIPVFQALADAIGPVAEKLSNLITTYFDAVGATNVFARTQIDAFSKISNVDALEAARDRLQSEVAGMEARQAALQRRIDQNSFGRNTKRELAALTEEVDGLNAALAFAAVRLDELRTGASPAGGIPAAVNSLVQGTRGGSGGGVGRGLQTTPSPVDFRRGLAGSSVGLGSQFAAEAQLNTKFAEQYVKSLQTVRAELTTGTDQFQTLATRIGPAIASTIANVVGSIRGGGGFFGGLSGLLGGVSSVAALIPGGQLVAGLAAGGAILSGLGASRGRNEVQGVRIESVSPSARRDIAPERTTIIQVVSESTGEILRETVHRIRRRSERDAIDRIPIGVGA